MSKDRGLFMQSGDAVEDIKQKLSIEEVIGEYVELKRAGRNLKALSPFSNEKTPSFMVSPEKQIWHDFSSGMGGNVFSFVMEMEGVDFRGALEILARKAGIDLANYQSANHSNSKLKTKLSEALSLSTKYYQQALIKSPEALNYLLKKRGFTKQTILDFKIGYSPNNSFGVVNALKKRGFTDEELKKAGLGTQRYVGFSDMFRGRIMIPLGDPQGNVIGFTARQLKDEPNAPKYINTPQTLLYDKSRHVYGLAEAKQAIRSAGYVVMVEGNLDVVSSHQAGIKQVVATAGTALTEYHLKILSRFTEDIRIAFDQDEAGLRATERAIGLSSKVGIKLGVIDVPDGKDPDELVQKSPELWQKIVTEPIYALEWLRNRYKIMFDISTAPGKKSYLDAMFAVLNQLKDPVEKEHYLNLLANDLEVSQEAMLSRLELFNTATPT
jgi:DNA primase